ncbi:Na/Pi cotransporter family protein [Azohydromonas caseinilytica]|uniref:Na/Pi cotransporter family protein n=1 Tax=Azohydromonas caseinilytica TaxID=2728836 RepID=A0A848FFW0_9BURK|nr:Na/Pi cotransporter family protein [Azohydromonas caseinilytica]NML17725.1 Na/Pi cotransporter family protein [Azohydromonas caseinilytica]
MTELLNLLAAIALLVWGTFIVRTGVLRLFGENLRHVLARSLGSRPSALLSGMGVTMLLQSGTATCMLMASFVGRQLVPTSAALAVMLGADMGSSLMAVVFSFDLSWLSPLLIFVGVVMFISREKSAVGRFGRVLIGLGLITLALHLIMESTHPLVASPVVRALLSAMPREIVPNLLMGALLAVLSYSSLAIVLLTATLAAQGLLAPTVALGLVLGANLGSGLLGVLSTLRGSVATRRLPVGNLLFKVAGCVLAIPLLPQLPAWLQLAAPSVARQVVLFHLGFNVALALLFVAATGVLAQWLERWLTEPPAPLTPARPQHLDPMALDTPSLAISCAAREALHQADIVETMLRGIEPVLRHDDLELAQQLRKMDDTVDALYSAIKFYLTQISREALSEREGRRWTDIVSFTINMEQIGDIIERVLQDIEDKKIRKKRRFSDAGMAEIVHLHQRLLQNLRLGMSVFLEGNVHDAQKLLEEKARFRNLEHEYAASHIVRLQANTPHSIETSSLHLDLISDLKRINSHICSIAYPILESNGALAAPARQLPAASAAAVPMQQVKDV